MCCVIAWLLVPFCRLTTMTFPCTTSASLGLTPEPVFQHFPPTCVCSLILLYNVDPLYLQQVRLIQSTEMESPEFSLLSSLRGEFKSEDYIQPHYREPYRLAIDCLVKGGRDSYQEFLKAERLGSFLSEEELLFITKNAEQLPPQNHLEEVNGSADTQSSSGTYWPVHSDVETPDLDLGWPEVMHDRLQTNIDLLFHPARQNSPTIKEVVRKNIQEARKVIKTTAVSQIKLCYTLLHTVRRFSIGS